MNTKTLIIASIAVVVLVLGGIVLTQTGGPTQDNATAYLVPLKSADLGYIQIDAPENSTFEIKNKFNETGKGMVYLKNTGNFTKEIEGIIISKNLTDQLISENMQLDSQTNDTKVYKNNNIYQIVKTVDDTDIILTGQDLHVLTEMADTLVVKDTKNITTPISKKVKKTPVEEVVDKNKEVKKAKKETPKVETTRDNSPKVETPKVETTSEPVVKKSTTPLYIGGGIFKTGSGLSDKTIAKIYVGGEHAGDTVKIKIKYYRDGDSLNNGNLVTKTVDSDGYIQVASADAYSKFPDKAYMELYDADGVLQMTQTVTLTPDSTTQYF